MAKSRSRGPGWHGETQRHREVQLARFGQGDSGADSRKGGPDPRLLNPPSSGSKGYPKGEQSFSEILQASIDRQNRRAQKNREAVEAARARVIARRGGPDPNAPPGAINILDLVDDDPKPEPRRAQKKKVQGDSGPKKSKPIKKDPEKPVVLHLPVKGQKGKVQTKVVYPGGETITLPGKISEEKAIKQADQKRKVKGKDPYGIPPEEMEKRWERARAFHASRTPGAQILDNSIQAQRIYPYPTDAWLFNQYNRTDVEGIDTFDPGTGAARRRRETAGTKDERKQLQEMVQEVEKEGFTAQERKIMEPVEFRVGAGHALGVHHSTGHPGSTRSIGLRASLIEPKKPKSKAGRNTRDQGKEVLTHEMVHDLRLVDKDRPLSQRSTVYRGKADRDLEESMTELESVGRRKTTKGAGYYSFLKTGPPFNTNVREDKVRVTGDKQARRVVRGKQAWRKTGKAYPKSHISRLDNKKKAELVDIFIDVDKKGAETEHVHLYNPTIVHETKRAKGLEKKAAVSLANEAGPGAKATAFHDGKPEVLVKSKSKE